MRPGSFLARSSSSIIDSGGVRELGAIGEEGELRHAPGRFEPFGAFGEIDARRRLAVDVDQREVRQVLGEGAEQQLLLLHDAEVLAVDPDEVGAAVACPPSPRRAPGARPPPCRRASHARA